MYVKDGYFYMMDHDLNVLVKKVDDGSTSFTYPTDSYLSSQARSLEYGGGYFWTLHSNDEKSVIIKKWFIENFICKLKGSYTIGNFSDTDVMADYVTDDFDDGSYDPPWSKEGPSGSIITVSGTEAIVNGSDFGSGSSGWGGPYLEMPINTTSDFYVKCRFKYRMQSSGQMFRFIVALMVDDDYYLEMRGYDAWAGFIGGYASLTYDGSTNLYNANILTNDVYNTFELKRSGDYIYYYVNGIERYSGVLDTVSPNSIRLYFYRYFGYTPPDYIKVDYVTMSGIRIHGVSSQTISVEGYNTTLCSGVIVNDNHICVNDYYDTVISGADVRVGPTSSGTYQYKYITSVSGSKLYTDSSFSDNVLSGTAVEIANSVWVFNDYSFESSDPGSLYRFTANDISYLGHYDDIEYAGIGASTFLSDAVKAFKVNDTPALVYVKSTNLKFMDVRNLSNVEFMTMDNIRTDGTTVLPIYDLSVYNDVAFRLQDEATYYGVNNTWSNYNYQVSPIRRFVDSITVAADSSILNSDGVSVVDISSTVFDQYNDPVFFKLVFFEDDNDGGYMTISPSFTASNGVAKSAYRSGTTPAHVTITATATQND